MKRSWHGGIPARYERLNGSWLNFALMGLSRLPNKQSRFRKRLRPATQR
jgi:hypothetical protein